MTNAAMKIACVKQGETFDQCKKGFGRCKWCAGRGVVKLIFGP